MTELRPNPATWDPVTDTLTIFGIRYSASLFETLAQGPTGAVFQIVGREDGTISLRAIGLHPFTVGR